MGYSLADLRRVFYRAENNESVSDAEYRELADAMDAGLNFRSIADMADKVSTESFNETYNEANRQWAVALQNRLTTPVRWLMFGDSYVELGHVPNIQNKLGYVFAPNTIPPVVSGGYQQASTAFGLVNGGSNTGAQVVQGPMEYANELTAGETTGNIVDVGGRQFSFFFDPASAGTVDIIVDGATLTTFDTTTNNGVYNSAVLRTGTTHTVRLNGISGTTRFWGFHRSNPMAEYMKWYWAGKSGATLQDWIDSQVQNLKFIEQVDPHRITLEFGINDSGGGGTIETYLERLETVVAAIRGVKPNVSLELWVPPRALGRTTWESFSRKMRSKARELGMNYVDVYEVLGSLENADDVFQFSGDGDQIHLTTLGQELASSAHAEAAIPPSHAIDAWKPGHEMDFKVYTTRPGTLGFLGKYTTPPEVSRSTLAMTLNRVYYIPIRFCPANSFAAGTIIQGVAAEVTVIAAGTFRFGVYANAILLGDSPGDLLLDVGSVSCNTLGLREVLREQTLGYGTLVWLAIVAQTAAPTVRSFTPVYNVPATTFVGTTPPTHFIQDGVTGALPTTATIAEGTGTVPLVAIKG